jgi:nucleoside phosphorylase
MALAGLFELFTEVECVVLNACYSESQAEAIAQHVDYVIGISREIKDEAATIFAVSFYDAIGAGKSIEFAYRLGCNAIQFAGISEGFTPVLKTRLVHPRKDQKRQTAENLACISCGSIALPDARFCRICGAELPTNSSTRKLSQGHPSRSRELRRANPPQLHDGANVVNAEISVIGCGNTVQKIGAINATAPSTIPMKGTDPMPDALSSRQAMDFVFVTALPEERDAVLDRLQTYRQLSPFADDVRTYFQAELPVTFSDGSNGTYSIVVMPLLGMGRVQAAAATADAIRRWHPRYVLLIGIGGGVASRGIKIGDILISDQIVDYELQKLTPNGPEVRWEVHRADARLLGACRNLRDERWQDLMRIRRPGRGQSKLHIGPIASGDKVIAFADVLARYRDTWPKLIGVEMEAAGVATAAFQSPDSPGFFMIRAVSDLADENKNSPAAEKWRSYACDMAASFAITLLKSGPVLLSTKTDTVAKTTKQKR